MRTWVIKVLILNSETSLNFISQNVLCNSSLQILLVLYSSVEGRHLNLKVNVFAFILSKGFNDTFEVYTSKKVRVIFNKLKILS